MMILGLLLAFSLIPEHPQQYYYELHPEFTEATIRLSASAHAMGADRILHNPDLVLNNCETGVYPGHAFDHFDFTEWNASQPELRYIFVYTVETLEGRALDREVVRASVRFAPGSVSISGDETEHRFTEDEIRASGALDRFFATLVAPDEPVELEKPRTGDFVLRLYWQELETTLKAWPATVRMSTETRFYSDEHEHLLAAAYCAAGDPPRVSSAPAQARLGEAARILEGLLGEVLPPKQRIERVRAYLDNVPNDRAAWSMLLSGYVDLDRYDLAHATAQQMKPFFEAGVRQRIAHRYRQQVAELLARRETFTRDPAVRIDFITPTTEGVITKNNLLRFAIDGNRAAPIRIECTLDGEVFADFETPPSEVPFTCDRERGTATLEVRAWFYDGTCARASIQPRIIRVDMETRLYATRLRASVTDGNKLLTDLSEDDFRVRFKGEEVPLVRFARERRPLYVAIVLDSSESMRGKKMNRCLSAMSTFLDNLGAEDRAALIVVDNKVLRAHRFTGDFDALRAAGYSLDPRYKTALYDGLYVAGVDLRDVPGIPVIIAVSDGGDTYSVTGERTLADRLVDSEVMVYSIAIGNNIQALADLSRATGSIYTNINWKKNLDKTMARIYEELESFYALEVHTETKPEPGDLDIALRDRRGVVRTRALSAP